MAPTTQPTKTEVTTDPITPAPGSTSVPIGISPDVPSVLPSSEPPATPPAMTVGSTSGSGSGVPSRHWLAIVLVVLLVAAVGAAGYFYWQNNQSQNNNSELQAQVTALSSTNTQLKNTQSDSAQTAATIKAYCDASVASTGTCSATVTNISGNFAVGSFTIGKSSTVTRVVLKKSDNVWTVVYAGQTAPGQAVVTTYAIPTTIVAVFTPTPSPSPSASATPSPSPAK